MAVHSKSFLLPDADNSMYNTTKIRSVSQLSNQTSPMIPSFTKFTTTVLPITVTELITENACLLSAPVSASASLCPTLSVSQFCDSQGFPLSSPFL